METEIKKWKILQIEPEEYILLSSENNIQKIKGKNSRAIIDVLDAMQSNSNIIEAKNKLLTSYEEDFINDVIEWLEYNKFIIKSESKSLKKINIIGEFSKNEDFLLDFLKNLPVGIIVNKVFNLSKSTDIFIDKDDNVITLLVAPFWYNKENIKKISKLIIETKTDFLHVEIFNNGIALGPLMNSSKGTVCLNCIEKRKIFNFSNPTLILENIIKKDVVSFNELNVLELGNFKLNKAFIYNELEKIILNDNKSLYNKSVFIDYNKYENNFFKVIKTPDCEICNSNVIYNPL